MLKNILAVSLVLVLLFPFIACDKEVSEQPELPSAQEIVNGAVESLNDVRTYQFDMDMTMNMLGEAKGEAVEITAVLDCSGTLDLESRNMNMDMAMGGTMPGEQDMKIGTEVYFIGDTMYMMMDVPGMDSGWVKLEVPEGAWEQMSQTEVQVGLLKTSQVNVIGSEDVRGVDCYVLQLIPDVEQLWQLAAQQAGISGESMLPDIAEESLREMFRSFSVKQWIARDTYFLTKAEVDMVIELNPEAVGAADEAGVINMDIFTVMLAYNYNQPISIVLPVEAEEAMEMPKP